MIFSPLFDLCVKGWNSIHTVEHSKGAGLGQQRAYHAGAVDLYHFKVPFFHLAGIIKAGASMRQGLLSPGTNTGGFSSR